MTENREGYQAGVLKYLYIQINNKEKKIKIIKMHLTKTRLIPLKEAPKSCLKPKTSIKFYNTTWRHINNMSVKVVSFTNT